MTVMQQRIQRQIILNLKHCKQAIERAEGAIKEFLQVKSKQANESVSIVNTQQTPTNQQNLLATENNTK
jgi:hypothetical protein